MNTVLFLCTGNYYRSRFAELYFNAGAGDRGLSWRAESRGLSPNCWNPGPIAERTVAWLKERGLVVPEEHRFPLWVTEADLKAAHLIVAVKEMEHRPLLEEHFPTWLDQVEFWHIHDVDCAHPDVALPELAAKIEELMAGLAADKP